MIIVMWPTLKTFAQIKIFTGGGINISHLDLRGNFDIPYTLLSRSDFYINVRPELPISSRISISNDIQFCRKGYKHGTSSPLDEFELRASYLDIIPQVSYQILSYLDLYGGISLGLRLDERLKINNVWNEVMYKLSNKMSSNYVLGIRIYPYDKLSVGVQFSGGLSQFFDVEFTDAFGNTLESTNRLYNFQVGAAYQIY